MNLETQLTYMLEVLNERLETAIIESDIEQIKYIKDRIEEIEQTLWPENE